MGRSRYLAGAVKRRGEAAAGRQTYHGIFLEDCAHEIGLKGVEGVKQKNPEMNV